MVASLFTKATDLPMWSGSIILVVLAGGLHALNAYLIAYYIEKDAPGLLEVDMSLPPPEKGQQYLWERTAGLGIVPKWVSWFGIASLAYLAGAIIWIILIYYN